MVRPNVTGCQRTGFQERDCGRHHQSRLVRPSAYRLFVVSRLPRPLKVYFLGDCSYETLFCYLVCVCNSQQPGSLNVFDLWKLLVNSDCSSFRATWWGPKISRIKIRNLYAVSIQPVRNCNLYRVLFIEKIRRAPPNDKDVSTVLS